MQSHYRGNVSKLVATDGTSTHTAPGLTGWAPEYEHGGEADDDGVTYSNSDPRPGKYGKETWDFAPKSEAERRLRRWCEATERVVATTGVVAMG